MKLIVNKIVFILMMLVSFEGVFSQTNPPPPPSPPPGDVPVDGGVWFMLVVGIVFGYYSIRYIYKNKRSSI
ncbi:PID-CTERM protein-sorting domain-containing protein [Flavobacterium sp.]|uniref:PID-CTERM protein-sorting domain-containing protein n=1 Tax=Flavobacterium sp. TaxID=239 RepID=UPI0040484E7A